MRRANEMQQETSNDDVATGIPKKKESERRREAVRACDAVQGGGNGNGGHRDAAAAAFAFGLSTAMLFRLILVVRSFALDTQPVFSVRPGVERW